MPNPPFDLERDALRAWLTQYPDQATIDTINAFKLRAQAVADNGDLDQALALLDRAAIIAEAAADPLAEALIWRGRANVLQRHERLEEALQASQKDAARCEQHGTPFDVALARTIQVYVLGALGRIAQAIAIARWIRPHYDEANFTRGQAHLAMNLAQVHTMAWQLQDALREYDVALTHYRQMERPLKIARVQHNKGVTFELLGDLKRAQTCYAKAYPTFVEAGDLFMLVKTQYNLAMLAIRRGAFEQALAHLDQARADLEALPDAPDRAYVDWFEAWVRKELGQRRTAQALIEKALTVFQRARYRLDTAQAHLELSELLAADQNRSAMRQALEHLEQAKTLIDVRKAPLFTAWIDLKQAERLLALDRRVEAQIHAETARSSFKEASLPLRLAQSNIVLANILRGPDPERARALYHAALEHTDGTFPLLAARCWHGLGHLAAAEGDHELAEHHYETAYEVLDQLRHRLSTHQHQAGFVQRRQIVADEVLKLLHAQPQAEGRLLAWVERLKAGVLADLLSRQPPDQQISAELRTLLQERERLRRERDQRLAELQLEREPDLAYSFQQASTRQRSSEHRQLDTLDEIRRALRRVEEHIARARPLGQSWRRAQTLSPSEIQSLLDSKTILLSYYTLGDALHAVIVSTEDEGIHTYTLPTSFSQLEQRWRFLQRKLLQRQTPHQRLADLWQRLIAPLSTHLQGKTRLLVVPCRGLFNLPFAACYDPRRQRYLIEDMSVQLLPSATMLGYCRRQSTGKRYPLLVGYPGRPDQAGYLSNLKAEMAALQGYLPDADLLLDEHATYDNLLQEMPERNLVHVAGHAHYEAREPLASGVYLAEGRQLRASDLYVRRGYLQGATVVLSACSSGKGRPTGWDILGLHSAFLYAGAVSIVGGLWQVDDESTMRFMGALYQHLLNGEETAEALRHAQLALLAEGASPYHWAPFTLYGDSRVLFPAHTT